jgi:hypothetical protein
MSGRFQQLGNPPLQVQMQQPPLLQPIDAMGRQAGPVQRLPPFGGGGTAVPAYREIKQQDLRTICRQGNMPSTGTKGDMYRSVCNCYDLDTLRMNCSMRGIQAGRTKQQCIERLINY